MITRTKTRRKPRKVAAKPARGNLLRSREAAEIIGCTVSWVNQLCLKGKLPGAELNTMIPGFEFWMIPASSVDRYLPDHFGRGRTKVVPKSNAIAKARETGKIEVGSNSLTKGKRKTKRKVKRKVKRKATSKGKATAKKRRR